MNESEIETSTDKPEGTAIKNLELKDLLELIDKEFKDRFWWTWFKHYFLDVILSILIVAVLVLVLGTLYSIQALFTAELAEANLPILLTSLALVISFIGLMLKWLSTPMASKDEYVQEISRKNCEMISAKHKITNNLTLYILASMKAIKPKTRLVDAYELSPTNFNNNELVKRFYNL